MDDEANSICEVREQGSKIEAKEVGVEVERRDFDDAYVRGIHAIYNEMPGQTRESVLALRKDFQTVRKMELRLIMRAQYLHRCILRGGN